MRVGLFDAIRIQSLDLIFDETQTFIRGWVESYSAPIIEHLNVGNEEGFQERLLSLGGCIKDIFGGAAQDVRGGNNVAAAQAAMTISGSSWERLVTWYLNALGCGLNAVALNQRGQTKHLPNSYRDAFQVTINNVSISSDLDVVMLNWIGPENQDWMDMEFDSTNRAEMNQASIIFKQLIEANPNHFSVCVLSTKTNWNDSIQTPMLWNLIFTNGFFHPLVNVGRNQRSPSMFGWFSYGFATVPSTSIEGWQTLGSQYGLG